LKDDPHFHFRFVGGGPRRKELAERCTQKNIANISFAPYCRRDDLASNLREGDIGLVTQRQECLGTVVPSKVYGLMAAGRPILYIGPRTSTSADIIRRFHCGWQVDCGDGELVVDLLRKLEADRDLVIAAGIQGRRALVEHYDLPQGVGRICGIISGSSGLPADCVAPTSV
jgi:colanic acid biosynthesis glycosyl transferase WcaI